MSRNARYIVSKIRLILERNVELLKNGDVRRWLRVVYPLLLEYAPREIRSSLSPSTPTSSMSLIINLNSFSLSFFFLINSYTSRSTNFSPQLGQNFAPSGTKARHLGLILISLCTSFSVIVHHLIDLLQLKCPSIPENSLYLGPAEVAHDPSDIPVLKD